MSVVEWMRAGAGGLTFRPITDADLPFLARLYGGPAEVFLLAKFDGSIPGLRRPIVLLVDYVNQKIEQPRSKRVRSRARG